MKSTSSKGLKKFLLAFVLISFVNKAVPQAFTLEWPQVPGMQASPSSRNLIDPLWFAQDCLGALTLYRSGELIGLQRAVSDADKLLALQTQDSKGRRGWAYIQELTPAAQKCGIAGSLDAFSDGTCNPPETPYMMQTGYSVACLAQVSKFTRNPEYLNAAIAAIEDSWSMGVENATCQGSFDYFYSYHDNDAGRFVRNTNAIMGTGLVWLFDVTSKEKYKKRALDIANAEHCEIKAANFGYFGKADKRYESAPLKEARRIENHIPHQVKFLQLAAKKIYSQSAQQDAFVLLNEYLACTEPHCRSDNCRVWAIPAGCTNSANISPCMDTSNVRFGQMCKNAKIRFPRMSGFQLFLIDPLGDL